MADLLEAHSYCRVELDLLEFQIKSYNINGTLRKEAKAPTTSREKLRKQVCCAERTHLLEDLHECVHTDVGADASANNVSSSLDGVDVECGLGWRMVTHVDLQKKESRKREGGGRER
jgi:hypothetical protein